MKSTTSTKKFPKKTGEDEEEHMYQQSDRDFKEGFEKIIKEHFERMIQEYFGCEVAYMLDVMRLELLDYGDLRLENTLVNELDDVVRQLDTELRIYCDEFFEKRSGGTVGHKRALVLDTVLANLLKGYIKLFIHLQGIVSGVLQGGAQELGKIFFGKLIREGLNEQRQDGNGET